LTTVKQLADSGTIKLGSDDSDELI
jgi:hypothetical protein